MDIIGFTNNIDLAEILFTLFWVFFIGLIFYLRMEDKREGYPLESERSGSIRVVGFPDMPKPKTFTLMDGTTKQTPYDDPQPTELAAVPAAPGLGSPLVATGNAMLDGLGAAAYANREDKPDVTMHGDPRIVPLRVAEGFFVHGNDKDPRGMSVTGADGAVAGTVSDVWVDKAEPQIRYYEVELPAPAPAPAEAVEGDATAAPPAPAGQKVLLPVGFANCRQRKGRVEVNAIYANQFADVPRTKSPDQVTKLEEDKISAYYAGGLLYADAKRAEPIL